MSPNVKMIFGHSIKSLHSGSRFSWNPLHTKIFQEFIKDSHLDTYQCQETSDYPLDDLLVALGFESYGGLKTAKGVDVMELIEGKVRNKLRRTEAGIRREREKEREMKGEMEKEKGNEDKDGEEGEGEVPTRSGDPSACLSRYGNKIGNIIFNNYTTRPDISSTSNIPTRFKNPPINTEIENSNPSMRVSTDRDDDGDIIMDQTERWATEQCQYSYAASISTNQVDDDDDDDTIVISDDAVSVQSDLLPDQLRYSQNTNHQYHAPSPTPQNYNREQNHGTGFAQPQPTRFNPPQHNQILNPINPMTPPISPNNNTHPNQNQNSIFNSRSPQPQQQTDTLSNLRTSMFARLRETHPGCREKEIWGLVDSHIRTIDLL